LKELDLGHNENIKTIAPVAGMTSLTSLTADQCGVSDLAPLGRLTSLVTLDLNYGNVTNISVLENLTKLKTIDVGSHPLLTDIDPLVRNTGLKGSDVTIDLTWTGVDATNASCAAAASAIQALKARGVTVYTNC
jgi:Leucine-rich repeat (LRR) protein